MLHLIQNYVAKVIGTPHVLQLFRLKVEIEK